MTGDEHEQKDVAGAGDDEEVEFDAFDSVGGSDEEPGGTEYSEAAEDDPVELLLQDERRRRWRLLRIHPAVEAVVLLIVFILGLGSGYVAWGRSPVSQERRAQSDRDRLVKQVNPAEGFKLAVVYGDIGPKVVAAGGIDTAKFAALYNQNGKPLTGDQLAILRGTVNTPIVVNGQNSYFLLNFFWAVGLTNKNSILEQGPMMQGGKAQVGNFASTGGWTVGAKDSIALYSSAELIKLTPEQQARVEEVSKNAYRPCCGNSTYFPDCNHGMALLGLLELIASQGASVDQMYTAAKQVNAFWFPDQMLQVATYMKAVEGKDFSAADPKRVVSAELFSSQGYQQVFKQLADKGLIPEQSGNGSSCGV
jgi:hypothetical protein